MLKYVRRWAISHVNGDGDRVLTLPLQGRYTWELKEHAEAWLEVMRGSMIPRMLSARDMETLEVSEIDCHPDTLNPVSWFVTVETSGYYAIED